MESWEYIKQLPKIKEQRTIFFSLNLLIIDRCSLIADMSIHKSVLLKEAIDNLNLKKGNVVVDATLGGGGHSREILKKIGEKGKLIAIDQDEEAIENFRKNFIESKPDSKSEVIHLKKDNFSNLKKILGDEGLEFVDGILSDLGISSDQLENKEKGMSFLLDAELDMRMNKNQELTAKEIVNEWSQEEIEDILKKYGEEKFARNIARKIIERRKEKKINTTKELAEIISESIPVKFHPRKINPATKSFQAIRIAVNNELENLEKFIPEAIEKLNSRGRLAIITFNSSEDRIVKNIFRQNARGCICQPEVQLQKLQEKYIRAVEKGDASAEELEKALQTGSSNFAVCDCGFTKRIRIITKKPIIPSEEEIRNNPRARSAKLRVCEKI